MTGRGEQILFIHGLNHSGLIWEEVIRGLSEYFSCIAIDLPGFGDSPSVREPSIVNLAAYVSELISRQRFSIRYVVADSLGALIFLKLIETKAHAIEKALLCGCPINGLPFPIEFAAKSGIYIASLGLIHAMPFKFAKPLLNIGLLYTTAMNRKRMSDDRLLRSFAKSDPRTSYLLIKELISPQIKTLDVAKYQNIQFLVSRGEKDRVVSRSDAVRLSSLLSADLVEYEGAGHTPMLEAYEPFIVSCREFFR